MLSRRATFATLSPGARATSASRSFAMICSAVSRFRAIPAAILRDYAQAAEAAGYARRAMGEHVLGADPDRPDGWEGPYTYEQE